MHRSISVGEITIEQIVEQQGPYFDVHEFFPGLTLGVLEENRSWLEPAFLDPVSQRIILCIQSYIIRTAHHTILVDSCVGNHKLRPKRSDLHMMKSRQ